MHRDVLLERRCLCVALDGGEEVRPLGTIGSGERVLATDGTGGGDIHRHAVELFPYGERVDGRGALAAPQTDTEALTGTDVTPGDIEED